MHTKNEEKLAILIGQACTGRYAITLEGVATAALEQIGDELNALGFALDSSNHEVGYVPADTLNLLVCALGTRAGAISGLLHAARSGRLTLNDDADDQAAVDEGEARQ